MSHPTQPLEHAGPDASLRAPRGDRLIIHLLLGIVFGIILVKSEVVSWFRIQEMFRFQSFHMYGILSTAIAVAALSVALIKRFDIRTIDGEKIRPHEKEYQQGYAPVIGGLLFGFGWALTGACPGPLYALIGAGVTTMALALLSALAGAWTYGHLRPYLPH